MALKAYVYIVVVIVYLTTAFNIRCPNPLERNVRSKALCTDAHNYTCLFDENLMSYRESCNVKFDFQRPGYRVTLRTNRHAEACQDYLYQPVIFLSNESSNCEWKKSFCRKEGQLLSSNGTIKTDRQCRCNYDDGYTFVAEPKDVCYCVPSVEDCSCYRKQCSTKQSISPDHHCIDNFTWTQNVACLSISDEAAVVELQVLNVTVTSNYTEASYIQEGKRKVLITRLIYLILFEIFLLIICSSIIIFVENTCTGFNPTFSFLKERTEHTERNNKNEFDDIKIVMGKLAATNCLLLWGNPGCGKTTVLRKIADYYENDLGYKRITCYKPSEIFDQQCMKEKRIFVIDDIFGRFVLSYKKFLRLKELEVPLKKILEGNTIKLLITCSSVAFRAEYVKEISLFTDNTFELTKTSSLQYNKDTDSKHLLRLSKQTPPPSIDIKSEAEKLRKSNYEAWCCLFICIIKQGCIDETDLVSDDDHMLDTIKSNVCTKLNIHISRKQFEKYLVSLIGAFLKKENMLFLIKDTSVFEVFAVYFGQEFKDMFILCADPEIITQHCCLTSCPDIEPNGIFRIQVDTANEELYFRRIKEQLLDAFLSEVFSVRQMDSKLYRNRLADFLKYLNKNDLNQISTSTCKINNNETALTLTRGYVKIQNIFREATIRTSLVNKKCPFEQQRQIIVYL